MSRSFTQKYKNPLLTYRKLSSFSLVALIVVSVIIFTSAIPAHAAPVPQVTFSNVDAAPMIGESTSFQLTFQNTGDATGFGPYVDMVLPEDFELNSVSMLGVNIAPQTLGPYPAGITTCFDHPVARTIAGTPVQVCLTPTEESYVHVLLLPFGSFTSTQAPAILDVSLDVDSDAVVNVAQNIQVRTGFHLGNDALNNPTSDPSFYTSFTSTQMTPTVLKLQKRYVSDYLTNEYEIVPGVNNRQRFRITADVANGATVTDLAISDTLQAPFVRINQINITPGGTSDTSTGPTATITWPSITGTASQNDAQYDVLFEVPYRDGGNLVLTGGNAYAQDIPNTAIANADFLGTPLTPVNATLPNGNTIAIRSLITQKTVGMFTDTGASGYTPGDTIVYTIRKYISDYAVVSDMETVDILDDGLTFVNGSSVVTVFENNGSTPVAVLPGLTAGPGAGETTLTYDLSTLNNLYGGCVPNGATGGPDPDCAVHNDGRTMVEITFRATIDDTYDDLTPILQGHDLNNRVDSSANMLSPTDLTLLGTTSNTSSADVDVRFGGLTKSLYAVNGSLSIPSRLAPGDSVTYRLQYDMPSTDFDSFKVDDYLPLPIFSNTEMNGGFSPVISVAAPVAGTAKYGPTETLYGFNNIAPTMSSEPGNVVRFSWGATDDPSNLPRHIDILFTVTIQDQPYAPGMFLTNQATATENNIIVDQTRTDISTIELEIPEPKVTKGIVATTSGVATFSPFPVGPVTFSAPGTPGPIFNDPIISDDLDTTPINSNISGVDAGDLVTYALVVENKGKGNLYNTQLNDVLPTGMVFPGSGINLSVTDGTGAPLAYTNLPGGFFGSGISITPSIDNKSTAIPGSNIIVITYDLEVASSAQPKDIITNEGKLTRFAASNGGVNYVVDQSQYQDIATATVNMPLMLKNITSTALGDTTGNNVVIGEEITYTVTLKVPEGQMTNVIATDVLDACLALTNLVSLNATSGITSSQGSMATVLSNAQVQSVGAGPANAARRIILDYGTLTNTNRDNSTDDIITLIYRAIPINASNCLNTNTRRNAITLEWNTAPNAQQLVTLSPLVTIREPSISVNKTFTPSSGDSATATRVRITVTAGSAPRSPAYNVALSDVLSSTNFDYQGNLSHFSGVAPDSLNESSGTVSATWAQLNPGQSSSIEFDVRLQTGLPIGTTHSNTATATWMSYPTAPTGVDTYNSLAVRRTGNTSDIGGSANNYSSNGSANFSNTAGLSKSVISTSHAHTSASNVAIGESVRYRLTTTVPESITNGVIIRDQLPTGIRFISGSAKVALVATTSLTSSTVSGAFVTGNETTVNSITPSVSITGQGGPFVSGTDVDFDFGTLTNSDNDADSEFIVIEFDALILNEAGVINGSSLGNTYQLFRNTSTLISTSINVDVAVVEPRLVVAKSVDNLLPNYGNQIQYSLNIDHALVSSADAFDLTVGDSLPSGLTLVPGSVTGSGWTIVESGNGFSAKRSSYTLGSPTTTITYQATVDTPGVFPPTADLLTNNAHLDWTSLPEDADPGERNGSGGINNYYSDSDVTVSAHTFDLAITKTADQPSYNPGETIIYDIEASNVGGRNATNTVITEHVPANTTFDQSNSTSGWSCADNSPSGTTCTFTVTPLNAGSSTNVYFAVTIDSYSTIPANIASITNNASIAGDPSEGNEVTTTNNSTSETSPLNIADVAVTKSASDNYVTYSTNYEFQYSISVTNNGPNVATNVEVYDELPDGISYLGPLAISDIAMNCNVVNDVLECGMASLAAGVSVTIAFDVRGDSLGQKVNEVSVLADQNDPNRSNNLATESTAVGLVDLSIEKNANKDKVNIGDEVIFTIRGYNNGPDRATNTVISDTFPQGIEILVIESSVGQCNLTGQTISCNIGTLENGQEAVVSVRVRATRSGDFFSPASISTDNFETVLSNNINSAGIIVRVAASNLANTGSGYSLRLILSAIAMLFFGSILVFIAIRTNSRTFTFRRGALHH